MRSSDVSVVLVHGAWADGSRLVEDHPAAGSRGRRGVCAVAAADPRSGTTLQRSTAPWSECRVRSSSLATRYGGAVMGGTHSDKVRALVYVAALAPDAGETVADMFYRTEAHPQAPKLAPDEHGLIYLPEAAFGAAFAQNAGAEELAVLAAVQRPISPACITVALPRPLWKDRPAWYLVAEQDRMIAQKNQRFMAERMRARVRSQAVDHTAILTAPAVVLDLLHEAIARGPRRRRGITRIHTCAGLLKLQEIQP